MGAARSLQPICKRSVMGASWSMQPDCKQTVISDPLPNRCSAVGGDSVVSPIVPMSSIVQLAGGLGRAGGLLTPFPAPLNAPSTHGAPAHRPTDSSTRTRRGRKGSAQSPEMGLDFAEC
eukprot:g31431.t1